MAPLVLIFTVVAFPLCTVVYYYHTLYVAHAPDKTGGELFPRAINQLFLGLYVMELSLIGLFILVKDIDSATGNAVGNPCIPQAIMMTVVLALTALFQIFLNRAFQPVFRKFPFLSVSASLQRPTNILSPEKESFTSRICDFKRKGLRRKKSRPDLFDTSMPEIWIPKDGKGIINHEIERLKFKWSWMRVTHDYCILRKDKVDIRALCAS